MLLGCFLGLSLVLTAYVKSYVWLIMIGVAVVIAILFYVFRRRSTA
jgi:LPXTG-motif cell wall-anchored protein